MGAAGRIELQFETEVQIGWSSLTTAAPPLSSTLQLPSFASARHRRLTTWIHRRPLLSRSLQGSDLSQKDRIVDKKR